VLQDYLRSFRYVLCRGLLSRGISLKTILEETGYTITELIELSRYFFKYLCLCALVGTGIAGSKSYIGAELLFEGCLPGYRKCNGWGFVKVGEKQCASKYPNEIHSDELAVISHRCLKRTFQ